MAFADTEIEIKLPLTEEKFHEIRKKLEKIAILRSKNFQEDEYYTPPHRNFVGVKYPYEWLSIRKRGNKSILNYKRWHPENAEITTHCDEFETEINADQTKKLFKALNFEHLVTVAKERETWIHRDGFEIAMDNVKELGHFIEIEATKDLGGIEETRKRLFDFAKILDIDTSARDLRGYPHLLMKKKGLVP